MRLPGLRGNRGELPVAAIRRLPILLQRVRRERDADLSGFIEITFTLARAVRESRYHDPESLDAESYALDYRFTANGVVDGGPSLRDFYRRHAVLTAFVEPGETRSFPLEVGPGFVFFTSGPVVEVRAVPGRSDHLPVRFHARRERFRCACRRRPRRDGSNTSSPTVPRSASRCSASTSPIITRSSSPASCRARACCPIRRSSTSFHRRRIVSADGLGVTEITLLFTDITGSTALYERIGDVKAFQLVQEHFGLLRDAIRRHSGALVKTIGDAVMASFHRPLDALQAALAMRAAIAGFNQTAGAEMIALKMGAHVGTCLAVTLNGQLDYFGRAVNLAARIQGVASPNEICISDEMYRVRRRCAASGRLSAGCAPPPGQGHRPGDRRPPHRRQRLVHWRRKSPRPARRA